LPCRIGRGTQRRLTKKTLTNNKMNEQTNYCSLLQNMWTIIIFSVCF
jgi:hypothetical protein